LHRLVHVGIELNVTLLANGIHASGAPTAIATDHIHFR
jgi:hypothetical protein